MDERKLVDEAMRYLGAAEDPMGTARSVLEALAGELLARVRPRHALRVLPVAWEPLTLGGEVTLPGGMARRMLAECGQAALLVCTLGAAFDAWMRAEQARDMARAVMLDALGSALAEQGCDAAEAELAARFPGKHLTDRFSPGYGDLPLSVQPELLAATDAARRLGVQATESCLLVPQKTVTAIIGIADKPQPARVRGCAACMLREGCAYRKGGMTCEV